MQLKACNCRAEHYERVQRSWWMRMVWNRRLYQCAACGQVMFIRPTEVLFRRVEENTAKAGSATRTPAPAG